MARDGCELQVGRCRRQLTQQVRDVRLLPRSGRGRARRRRRGSRDAPPRRPPACGRDVVPARDPPGVGAVARADRSRDRRDVGRSTASGVVTGELGHRRPGGRDDRAAAARAPPPPGCRTLRTATRRRGSARPIERSELGRRSTSGSHVTFAGASTPPQPASADDAKLAVDRRGDALEVLARLERADSEDIVAVRFGPSGVKTSSTAFGTTAIWSPATPSSSTSSLRELGDGDHARAASERHAAPAIRVARVQRLNHSGCRRHREVVRTVTTSGAAVRGTGREGRRAMEHVGAWSSGAGTTSDSRRVCE